MKFKMIMMIVMLLIIGVGMPMIMPGSDGKPMMTWRDWLPDSQKLGGVMESAKKVVYSANDLIESEAGIDVGAGRAKLYKWQDEHGNWHFSDKASEKVAAAKQVVQSMPQAKNSMQAPPNIDFGTEERRSYGNVPNIPLPTTVPIANIPKLIDDAKNVQKLADERAKQFSNL